MPVLDERGRLFGKINLIDAVVVVLALGLIPLAYGAFCFFESRSRASSHSSRLKLPRVNPHRCF